MQKKPTQKIIPETTTTTTNILHSKRGSALEPLLHSEHSLQIEKLVVGGEGLARLVYEEKKLVVFVPNTAPGETARIRISSIEKNHLRGELLNVEHHSPHRREAPCEYFNQCGGCSWQHITEAEQLRQKELILTDLLKKFIPTVPYELLPTVRSELSFNYRNRIQLKQLGTELGYFKKSSHSIVDIDRCLIADKNISDQIPLIKKNLRPASEIKKFELRINQNNQFEHYPIGESGEGLAFSQVNNSVNSALIASVLKIVETVSPKLLTELYAGAGNFTFPLLETITDLHIEAAELNSDLTRYAVEKLKQLRLQKRLHFFTANCDSFVKRRPLSGEFILLDPPRSGCSQDVLAALVAANSKNILYLSCHPSYLARDLKEIFTKNPNYRIRHLQIFDMFPQTDHFETLVWLSKN